MRIRVLGSDSPPWPDETNTGPTGALTPDSGTKNLEADGFVYENFDLFGSINVEADDVVIRNCRIESQSFWGIRLLAGSVTIEDCEVIGSPSPSATGCIALDGGNGVGHILRCNIHSGEDAVRMNPDSTLRDSYIHDLLSADVDPHYDGVGADGRTGVEITGNRILNPNNQTSVAYVGDILLPALSEVLFANNYVAGGGYCIYSGGGTGLGIRVINNVFSTQYFPNGGELGPVTGWVPSGNTWSNNIWIDGPNVGLPVNP